MAKFRVQIEFEVKGTSVSPRLLEKDIKDEWNLTGMRGAAMDYNDRWQYASAANIRAKRIDIAEGEV